MRPARIELESVVHVRSTCRPWSARPEPAGSRSFSASFRITLAKRIVRLRHTLRLFAQML